jgi:hypothetical protein
MISVQAMECGIVFDVTAGSADTRAFIHNRQPH